ncbi:Predicted Peptidoglycan domain-containing protein [Faunimonas pinastri]|uniref:Predicted Peptidoglycan domain-containing protein n=1 Tax=Faunimonas pinastri TaxID=1855383 RepID=A0A1H9L149_9HYPH|nr:glycosyl hydrolase 108 family protein [Faunimonas pinastri]SER05120.1 Predicted Peptidoglycan domain-containing protein [Faunimonas pinastri]
MTAADFEPSLRVTLAYEGGVSDHRLDPGGLTKAGVTQGTYDAWRKLQKLATRSVTSIADAEIRAIYRDGYWSVIRGDDLPAGIDFAVFDFAVNSGPARAVKGLQKAVGTGADGVVGNLTLAAVQDAARKDEEAVIRAICEDRLAFMQSLGTWRTFGTGWKRRVVGSQAGFQPSDSGVLDYATMMARNDLSFGGPINPAPGKAWPEGPDYLVLRSDLMAAVGQLTAVANRFPAALA